MRRLLLALVLALLFCLMSPLPASAQELADYFQFSYDPVTFDKKEINGGEVFHATVAGRATCNEDLPLSASKATITSLVVGEHVATGAVVTLNPSYTVNIEPFPSKKDETIEIKKSVPLQFPAEAESGDYNVIGKIVKAEVKVGPIPVDVTGFLPQSQSMGTVKYTAPESPPVPENPPSSEPEPSTLTPESIPFGAHKIPPQEQTTPQSPQQVIPWWVWGIVILAGATTMFNIIWFLRHQR